MNSRERLRSALLGEEVDRLAFAPFLAYVWESFPREITEAGQLAFHHATGADPLWRGTACPVRCVWPERVEQTVVQEGDRTTNILTTPVGTLQWVGKRSEEGNTCFLIEHPLKTPEDFKIQTWIEEQSTFEADPEAVTEHFAGNGREGLSLGMLVPRMKTAYQSLVEHYVGTEELIYTMADDPGVVEALLEAMVVNDMTAARMAVESDAYEFFLTFEDSSTQNYSPTLYDRYIGAEIGQWCALLADAGKYYVQHACGHVAALLERMRDHGVTAVESLSPPPTGNISLADARAAIGTDMGIIGGIEPTAFLNLPEKQLGAYVEQVIADAGNGPFVLANADSCPPGVTLEKFRLVAEIAHAHRR